MLLELGLEKLQIGTHSFRKGVATFLSSMVGGPSPIAIYLRAGWSLGPVQSRYIMEGQGGDQLCGIAATGLTMTSTEFACLPPHFNASDGSVLTVAEWEDIVPGFSTYFPSHFRPVIPYLLASVIFHKEWLVETLPLQHPLFNSRLWTSGVMDRLSSKVLSGNGRNEISGLTATGIPPHVLIANEMVKLQAEMEAIRIEVMGKIDEMPEKVKATLLENFTVHGVVPITQNQVTSMISNLQETLLEAVRQQSIALSTSISEVAEARRDNSVGIVPSDGTYKTFAWGGRYNFVPQGFQFPK